MTSFAADIRPLFTPQDIGCMSGRGVQLGDYGYMSNPAGDGTMPDHANARHVYARLTGAETPQMPMGEAAWSADKLKTFSNWMAGGFQP